MRQVKYEIEVKTRFPTEFMGPLSLCAARSGVPRSQYIRDAVWAAIQSDTALYSTVFPFKAIQYTPLIEMTDDELCNVPHHLRGNLPHELNRRLRKLLGVD